MRHVSNFPLPLTFEIISMHLVDSIVRESYFLSNLTLPKLIDPGRARYPDPTSAATTTRLESSGFVLGMPSSIFAGYILFDGSIVGVLGGISRWMDGWMEGGREGRIGLW